MKITKKDIINGKYNKKIPKNTKLVILDRNLGEVIFTKKIDINGKLVIKEGTVVLSNANVMRVKKLEVLGQIVNNNNKTFKIFIGQ